MNEKGENIIPHLLEMGGAFLLGFAVGVALKKSFKVLIILLGLGLIFVFSLEHQNILTINNDNLQQFGGLIEKNLKELSSFLKSKMESFEVLGGVGAIAGFIAGIKYKG